MEKSRLTELEERMIHAEEWIANAKKNEVVFLRMIALFESIENALWLFVKLGNALKWLSGVLGALGIIWFGTKHLSK
jgi:hypothetical protein